MIISNKTVVSFTEHENYKTSQQKFFHKIYEVNT